VLVADPMSDDDFARSDNQTLWLTEYLTFASARLLSRLGASKNAPWVKRYEVLYALARALGFNPDDLSLTALRVLDGMVQPLGDAMNAHGDDWVSLLHEQEHHRIVAAATQDLTLGQMEQAISDFRCGRERVNCEAREAADALRAILDRKLATQLVKVFASQSRTRMKR